MEVKILEVGNLTKDLNQMKSFASARDMKWDGSYCLGWLRPSEVRNQILRLSLRTPMIAYDSRSHGLYPQILRVNRQLYTEGLDVLHGKSYEDLGQRWGRACPIFCNDHFTEEIHFALRQYGRIQHYDIYVEL